MTEKSPKSDPSVELTDPFKNDQDHDVSHPAIPWYLGTFFTNFIAGAVSSATAETILAPFDRVKLLLQLQKSKKRDDGVRYKGVFATFKRIYREQGFFSLWRGNSANLMKCLPNTALNFSIKDKFKAIFHESTDVSILSNRVLANLAAGGLAGSCALAIVYPFDYARTRLAVELGKGNNREFKTVWQTLADAYKSEGRLGLYRGFNCSIIGVFVYRSFYFGVFDTGVEILPPEYQHNFWIQFMIADLAGVAGSTISYPFDTVRRSMMMQSGSGHGAKRYKNYKECCSKIYNRYGFRGFYHGGFINGVRGFGGAMVLVIYDRIQTFVVKLHPNASKVSSRNHIDNKP